MSCGLSVPEAGRASQDPLIGRTVGGHYTFQELIGVGGMGRVYLAEQSSLSRTVAVKVIHPHLLHDDQTVERFYTEARAASRLNHPNSVSIIDFGRTEDGILYLVMEFLRGADLALVMQRDGPLPFGRICDILSPVLDALGEAHALEIVHRDLKPENIILRRFRSGGDLVKVVDFGLATIVGHATSVVRPGLVCGTPDYMSPEQARGGDVDGRGDLYSLGVVLFELLTDALPYEAETPTKVVLRHLHDPVPDPRVVAPFRSIPDDLAAIAMRALAKRPEDRFATSGEMAAALRAVRDRLNAATAAALSCAGCGVDNPMGMRFCGGCGTPLRGVVPTQPGSRVRSRSSDRFSSLPTNIRPLVGRKAELDLVLEAREAAVRGAIWVELTGEPGVGRTRLLEECAQRFVERGDVVVGAELDCTGAPVPYAMARSLIANLEDVAPEALATLPELTGRYGFGLEKAGLEELLSPSGLPSPGGPLDRSGAAAMALVAALRALASKEKGRAIVLVLDDVSRADELSQRALAQLAPMMARSVVLVLSVGRPVGLPSSATRTIALEGLTPRAAARLANGAADDADAYDELGAGARRHLPLYLEQLIALGEDATDDSMPIRLADAVAQRVDGLSVTSRRVLQALAVLGPRAQVPDIEALVELPGTSEALEELLAAAFVRRRGLFVEISHPLVAELVEGFIPAEARRGVHRQAFQLRRSEGAAPEVCAEHAFRAGEPFAALMMLERAGDRAAQCGIPMTAVHHYRRALEVARRAVFEEGDSTFEGAVVSFSRKLGVALRRAGDLSGADGVVREALDFTGHSGSERARMLLLLGGIASERARARDAFRFFGQALELVAGVDPAVEASLQLEIGRARAITEDSVGAGNAFRRALELLEASGAPALELALACLELAAVEREAGAIDRADAVANQGLIHARAASAPTVAAGLLGLLAQLAAAQSRGEDANRLFAQAAEAAEAGGDVTGCTQLSKHLSTMPPCPMPMGPLV